jgi:AGCS family alanine or glycine:cation symporter
MGLLYILMAVAVVFSRIEVVPGILADIIASAFTGSAAAGGAAGVTAKEALLTGVRRAAFSNEAGIGTAAMAHGAARTREPVREGLVAMLGPFIDTNVICTLTALVILSTGVSDGEGGATLTARAFESALSRPGVHLLSCVIVSFGLSTMISYSYYCQKCARYVLGESLGGRYVYLYLASIPLGAVWAQATVVNILDTAFALMAIPTLVGTLLLSPTVIAKTRDYFSRIDRADTIGPTASGTGAERPT